MYSIGEVSERRWYVFTVARSPVNLKVITSLKIESSTCVRFLVLRGSRVTCSALPISERRQIAFLTKKLEKDKIVKIILPVFNAKSASHI